MVTMLIGALFIGLLTAYYFGLKPGIIAGAGSALLFIVAQIVPGAQLGVYGLVAAFIIGICVMGPRMSKNDEEERKNVVRRWGKKVMGELWRRL